MLFKKTIDYITPGGEAPRLYGELLKETHILIAGSTGSGKSVLINSLIARLLMSDSPAAARIILIDPKRVELAQLQRLPHCAGYASELPQIVRELQKAVAEMENRYKEMQKKGVKKYDGSKIYIVIDEYADLIIQGKKQIEPLITRLAQLGRAANIHLIVATQRPTRDIIAGAVKANIDCKIALHTVSAQDSRNITGQSGAESLPRWGYAYIQNSDGLKLEKLPPIDEKLTELINFWNSKKCVA